MTSAWTRLRQLLDAPDSFAATAIGSYGLLIDTTIERDALEDELRAAWAELGGTAFLTRLRGLADQLLQRAPAASDAPAEGAGEEAAGTDGADARGLTSLAGRLGLPRRARAMAETATMRS